MTCLVDVDGFKVCIQVCMWLGFPSLNIDGDHTRNMSSCIVRKNSHFLARKIFLVGRGKMFWIWWQNFLGAGIRWQIKLVVGWQTFLGQWGGNKYFW